MGRGVFRRTAVGDKVEQSITESKKKPKPFAKAFSKKLLKANF